MLKQMLSENLCVDQFVSMSDLKVAVKEMVNECMTDVKSAIQRVNDKLSTAEREELNANFANTLKSALTCGKRHRPTRGPPASPTPGAGATRGRAACRRWSRARCPQSGAYDRGAGDTS